MPGLLYREEVKNQSLVTFFSIPALLVLLSLVSSPAKAMDRDARTILVAGGYGLAAGTVLGLASYPIAKSPRAIFVGSSVGLYLGIGLGIFHVLHREDPENPLRSEDELSYVDQVQVEAAGKRRLEAKPSDVWFETRFPVLRF